MQHLVVDRRGYGLLEGKVGHEALWLALEQASQSDLFLLVQLGREREHGAFLEPEHAHVEVEGQQRLPFFMAHQVQQLVERSIELLRLLDALLDQFASNSVYVRLDNASIDGLLAILEHESQVVERVLLEALVLRERGHNLGGEHVQNGLEEIEEADLLVFVRVEQGHVIHSLQVDVLTREIELLARQQNLLELLLIHLARVWPVFKLRESIEELLDVHEGAHDRGRLFGRPRQVHRRELLLIFLTLRFHKNKIGFNYYSRLDTRLSFL